MFSMKAGSMGEIPPSTRGRSRRSARMLSAASLTMAPKRVQSGSISKSQWDLLLGSFHSIAASTTVVGSVGGISGLRLEGARLVFAHEHLRLRMVEDREAGAAQHRLEAGPIGDPPVGGIAGVKRLDEEHLGI